jgi:hypothetical protein
MSFANLLGGDKQIFADGTYYAETLETNNLQSRDPIQEINLRSDLNANGEASITGLNTLEVFQLFSPQGTLVASLSGDDMFIQSLEVGTISGIVIDMSGVEQRLDVIIADISNDIVPLQTTANEILVNISNGIGAIDLSVSFVETNDILTGISNEIGSLATDICSYFSSQDAILVNISNGIGAIDTTALVDICSGIDTLVSETQSGNATLVSIDGFALKIDDYLQPKSFSIFSSSSAPALPFSAGFVFGSGVWKKIVCETSQSTIANRGNIITTFFDVSGAPAGTEPVLLRLNHPANDTYSTPASTTNFGTSFHDIDFPDGGLIFNNGIGVSCVSASGGATFNSTAITLYTLPT